MTAQFFFEAIQDFESNGTCKNILIHLKTLFRIFALHTLTKTGVALAQSRYLSPENFRAMNSQLLQEYTVIRPHMLSLVESFEMDDNVLLSATGSYDGNVYE